MFAPPRLKRVITLPMLIFYGVGTMVGGGFYALIGKVAGQAGGLTPVALILAGALALVNGFAFAELSSRYPVSAGEARYVQEGFHRPWLSGLTGWLVITTGIVSAATLSVATAGFLHDLTRLDIVVAIILVAVSLGGVAAWGVGQSVVVVVAITVIEVGALIFVVFVNARQIALLPVRMTLSGVDGDPVAVLGVFGGAFLVFYAFIGFEDMVNMAEEVKRPQTQLPRAIVISVLLTTILYVVVSLVVVAAGDMSRLVASNTPIAELVSGNRTATVMRLVSLLAGVNGALVQVVMASRVAYGLAGQGGAPDWMGIVHRTTRTPLRATVVMTAIILTLALFIPLTALAKITSAVILMVFALVNLSLWRIKGRDQGGSGVGPRYPRWLSAAGFLACVAVLSVQAWIVVRW